MSAQGSVCNGNVGQILSFVPAKRKETCQKQALILWNWRNFGGVASKMQNLDSPGGHHRSGMNNLTENNYPKPGSRLGVLAIEKRRHPRYSVELPLDYSVTDGKEAYGGIVANASQGGLLVYLPERVEIGTLLKIEIFYVNGLEFSTLKAVAKVVWYDLAAKERWGEHRYGLEFRQIEKDDFERLTFLLREVAK